jgi:hypothetical protein
VIILKVSALEQNRKDPVRQPVPDRMQRDL